MAGVPWNFFPKKKKKCAVVENHWTRYKSDKPWVYHSERNRKYYNYKYLE